MVNPMQCFNAASLDYSQIATGATVDGNCFRVTVPDRQTEFCCALYRNTITSVAFPA